MKKEGIGMRQESEMDRSGTTTVTTTAACYQGKEDTEEQLQILYGKSGVKRRSQDEDAGAEDIT